MFLLFLAGALLLNITPGPDMAFTLATSAKSGTRSGLAAAAGVVTGSLVWAALTAVGLAALLAASEHALTVIRMAGGAYLVYLGVKTYLHRHNAPEVTGAVNFGRAFRSGALTNMLNPKVGLFFLAFLPSFVDPAAGPVGPQIFILGVLFSFSGGLVLALAAMAAGRMRESLVNSAHLRAGLNTASASIFGGLGLYLVFSPTD